MSKIGAPMFKDFPKQGVLRQIARLNAIAGTPETAFKFPQKFNKVELFLIQKSVHGPSIGLKKFWRNNLPTLKFHNDNVEFVMTRIKTRTASDLQKVPVKIIVHSEGQEAIEIDCSNKFSGKILEELVEITKAEPVPIGNIPRIKE